MQCFVMLMYIVYVIINEVLGIIVYVTLKSFSHFISCIGD